MNGGLDETAAIEMARRLASAGTPADDIIRRLVLQGVDHAIAVSIVFNHTSAMDHTRAEEDEDQRFIRAFRRCWNRQLAAAGVACAAFLMALLGETNRSAVFLGLMGNEWGQISFGLIISVVVFSLFNYRCPACHGYLGKSINPSFCQRCGVRLR